MKRCPQCNLDYSDNTLEFCLQDGFRLFLVPADETEIPTVTLPNKFNTLTEKTANSPFSDQMKTLASSGVEHSKIPQANLFREKVVRQTTTVLEIAPVVVALAHNWWQWIYLNNQPYASFTNYVTSAFFLIWLFLLVASALVSLSAIKFAQNRRFAFVSLVILSINLILFMVPRK